MCSDKTGTLTLNKLSIDLAAAFPMTGEAELAVFNLLGPPCRLQLWAA